MALTDIKDIRCGLHDKIISHRCTALKDVECDGISPEYIEHCSFYKTTEQLTKENDRCIERCRELGICKKGDFCKYGKRCRTSKETGNGNRKNV